jgi:hypothetical protein
MGDAITEKTEEAQRRRANILVVRDLDQSVAKLKSTDSNSLDQSSGTPMIYP